MTKKKKGNDEDKEARSRVGISMNFTSDADHTALMMIMTMVMMMMAFRQIPTMTKSHHGGNLSLMAMAGFCHQHIPTMGCPNLPKVSHQFYGKRIVNKICLLKSFTETCLKCSPFCAYYACAFSDPYYQRKTFYNGSMSATSPLHGFV